jgi:hypothetical protein
MMNDLAKEVVVDAIRAYAESRLDQFLANTADGDASPPKWVTDIVGFDVVDRPAFLAGVQTMCDGSPAAKMIKGAADRVWNSMGPWHLQKEALSCLCKLFDEVFYSDVVSSFRGEGPANEARRQWHTQMKGMRQGLDEMLQLGLAFLTACAMELAEETKRDPSTITPAELDGQQLKLAAESELIFEMVAFIRLRNACFGIVDSKNAGEFGNFSLYLELLPIMQRIFVATNATSYVLLVNAEIERWLVASDNERKVHEVRAFVKISETGEGKLFGDEAGEHVQGLARGTLGHHYHTGKEHQIARVGFNLEILSQAAARCRRPPEREVVGAAAAAHSEGRNRKVTLGKSFWGPYKLFRARGLLRTGSLITVGGFAGNKADKRNVERGCLTTLNGQPITGRRALLFDVIEARCLAIAEAHVTMQKHGISVRKVPFNANAQLLDEGIEWDQAYGTTSAVIRGYTKAFRGDQLAVLKSTWSTTARRQNGTTAQAPSLPEEFQDPQDAFGAKTLLDFTLSQLRGQKSKKTALSEDQQVALLQHASLVIQQIVPAPARPASGSVKDTSIDADTLRLQVPS